MSRSTSDALVAGPNGTLVTSDVNDAHGAPKDSVLGPNGTYLDQETAAAHGLTDSKPARKRSTTKRTTTKRTTTKSKARTSNRSASTSKRRGGATGTRGKRA